MDRFATFVIESNQKMKHKKKEKKKKIKKKEKGKINASIKLETVKEQPRGFGLHSLIMYVF